MFPICKPLSVDFSVFFIFSFSAFFLDPALLRPVRVPLFFPVRFPLDIDSSFFFSFFPFRFSKFLIFYIFTICIFSNMNYIIQQ